MVYEGVKYVKGALCFSFNNLHSIVTAKAHIRYPPNGQMRRGILE